MKCPNCLTECITDKDGWFLCMKCGFRTKPSTTKISCLMAWVLCDDAGNEQIPAFQAGPNGPIFPMMGSDPQKILALKPQADQISARTGMKVKLLSFSERVEV